MVKRIPSGTQRRSIRERTERESEFVIFQTEVSSRAIPAARGTRLVSRRLLKLLAPRRVTVNILLLSEYLMQTLFGDGEGINKTRTNTPARIQQIIKAIIIMKKSGLSLYRQPRSNIPFFVQRDYLDTLARICEQIRR